MSGILPRCVGLIEQNGTIVPYSSTHHCAIKYKAFPIDCWVRDFLPHFNVRHHIGYSANETKRAAKCHEYSAVRGESFSFPLIEWGWDRATCQEYIRDTLGVDWIKSCCTYCPYQAREGVAARYMNEPASAADALFREHVALSLNPRMTLFPFGSARNLCIASRNERALELFDERLHEQQEWGLYRVERLWIRRRGKESGKVFTRVDRRLLCVARGERDRMESELLQLASNGRGVLDRTDGILRAYSHVRAPTGGDSCEGFWVVAPAVARDKVRHAKAFQEAWDRVTGAVEQLALF